jgi:hypothetical protein
VKIPATAAKILETDFKAEGIKKKEHALAALTLLAKSGDPVTLEMLREAISQNFHGKRRVEAEEVIERTAAI